MFVKAGRYVQGEPAVKYRGIFLNDEAPSLTNWVNEKYGGFNHKFYVKVFELLLRLKANYLWPAMWNSAFNEDDAENPRLADEYGIVMGTSHHEPMLRAQQEWKRHGKGPWDYQTNADGAGRILGTGNCAQQELREHDHAGHARRWRYADDGRRQHRAAGEDRGRAAEDSCSEHDTDARDADPQVWALYKEVQDYYEKGMRVPDDVTLLWCDDNWGNIRRLPTAEERKRPGGAGIYYHFDYVGDPRSYKWINTYPTAEDLGADEPGV